MALPKYKDIVDLVKKGATFEAQEKILALREAALELQEENIALKEELVEIKNKIDTKESLEFKGGVYYKSIVNGDSEGPFCARCSDSNSKLIRLQDVHYHLYDPQWECFECKSRYNKTSACKTR